MWLNSSKYLANIVYIPGMCDLQKLWIAQTCLRLTCRRATRSTPWSVTAGRCVCSEGEEAASSRPAVGGTCAWSDPVPQPEEREEAGRGHTSPPQRLIWTYIPLVQQNQRASHRWDADLKYKERVITKNNYYDILECSIWKKHNRSLYDITVYTFTA